MARKEKDTRSTDRRRGREDKKKGVGEEEKKRRGIESGREREKNRGGGRER